jgi:Flp pilus assembly pilin Flp
MIDIFRKAWAPSPRLRSFLVDAEEGTQAIEYLLIFAFVVVPCFWAILLLQAVLREVLGFETVLLTSPFF